MSLPVLYSFRRCPYAIRARLALKMAGVAVELREVVLRDKPAEMLALSPKGTVPVLQRPDGEVLEQSLDIMRWALAQNDPRRCMAVGEPADVQALIDANDGPFKRLLDAYKYPERHPERAVQAWRDDAMVWLHSLDQRLAGSPQLLGDEVSLADLALMPFVRQFAQVDADWFGAHGPQHVRAWLQGWTASALFEQVMVKVPRWQPGQEALRF